MEAKLDGAENFDLLHQISKDIALNIFDTASSFIGDKDTNPQRNFLLEVTLTRLCYM
jgi:hypothetical protein